MRNLKASLSLVNYVPALENADLIVSGQESENHCLSRHSSSIYVFKGPNIFELSLTENYCNHLYDLRNCDAINFVEGTKVIGCLLSFIDESLTICFNTGEVLSLSTSPDHECFCAINTKTELISMEWSPDQEYGVFVTCDNTLLLMTSSYNIIKEIDLYDSSGGKKEFISIGWGKKETQFHGSIGKNAATAPILPSNSTITDQNTYVSWRGDSLLFAVGFWHGGEEPRKVKIFNKIGTLQSVSELIPGLDGPLAWRPSGEIIALAQCYQGQYFISFMEKNGLKRNQFPLPSQAKVKAICWNEDSTILCTWVTEEQKQSIMFWTTGNYHWYMKQKIPIVSTPVRIMWDKMQKNRVIIFFKNGESFFFEYIWVTNTSGRFGPSDPAYVAVIDQDRVLLTSFRQGVVPPPMSQWSLECPAPVSQVVFPPPSERIFCLCAILFDGRICVFDSSKKSLSVVIDIGWLDLNPFSVPISLVHWNWVSPDIMVLTGSTDIEKTAIVSFDFTGEQLNFRNKALTKGSFIACSSFNQKDLLLETSDGVLSVYNIDTSEITLFTFNLPEPTPHLEYTEHGVFSLSQMKRLYMNETEIASKVTSFLLHYPFLLVTTAFHKLTIRNLSGNGEEVSTRKLEIGSKLVVASMHSVVLQLPRGNLETIQPRALTIQTVGKLLNSQNYGEAISLLRKQRIDLNLCVDHNPQAFVDNIELFVEQVDPQCISLLITELNESDSTQGPYSVFYPKNEERQVLTNKVTEVCSALLKAMQTSNNREDFFFPILCALVKINQTSEAIALANSQNSFQHLLFLFDGDKLYEEALSAYNLEAALKIAAKTKKDPKEYIPYLNSLRQLDPVYMKYTIDKSLGKMESALRHIALIEDEDKDEECFKLIQDHSLYSVALQVLKGTEKRYKTVCSLYGDHLHNKKNYEEAAIFYGRGGDFNKAAMAYLKVGNWQQCFRMANKTNCSEYEIQALAISVIGALRSLKRYSEVAEVCLKFLSDPEQAVEAYCAGKAWNQAIFTAETHKRPDLLSSNIKAALLDALEGLLEDIKLKKDKIMRHTSRLTVVRTEKQNRNNAYEFRDDMSDTQSEVSSVSSVKSTMTRSSKNTRKMQRKMWSLKEGNPREEQALVSTLGELIQASEKLTGEVHSTCLALLDFSLDEEASKLQNATKDILRLIENNKQIIWVKDDNPPGDSLDPALKVVPPSQIHPGWEMNILSVHRAK